MHIAIRIALLIVGFACISPFAAAVIGYIPKFVLNIDAYIALASYAFGLLLGGLAIIAAMVFD